MSEFKTNAEENVSAAQGTIGGYVYRAPIGTPLPDSYDWKPTDAWKCMGFVDENGETFSTTTSVQEFHDQNGDVVDVSQSGYGESFACSFIETKAATFESIYGEDAVTDENGTLKVNHTGAEAGAFSYAFLFLLKNGRRWVRYAEKCKRTEISDTVTNKSTVLGWSAKYSALKSTTTDGYFVDLFESTETEAESE